MSPSLLSGPESAALVTQLQTAWPAFIVLEATPLSGGLSNRCWRVTLQHRVQLTTHTCVWRPCSAATSAFGVSREHEYRLLASLCDMPLAPAPFAYSETGLLVEWVEGVMAPADLPMATLLQLQARIHAIAPPAWQLDCRERAVKYWTHIAPADQDADLCALHQQFQYQPPKPWFAATCCHHDLGAYNVIIPPSGDPTVIDWEYAAAGDPSLDLALTISANQWDVETAVFQYCQQREEVGLPLLAAPRVWLEAVNAWLPWCDYLAMLWFFVGAQLWDDETYRDSALSLKQRLLSR
ncbi:phosphotransferase [Photobacterium japonica]|uniref:phosphotransferase n=1 Tax=Photobacterium japonica TaxID=2910235 RepID=UPI003D0C6400